MTLKKDLLKLRL